MYLYSHSNQKKPGKFKGFFTILLTVFITTVVIENILILMSAERFSYSGQRLNATPSSNYNNLQMRSQNDLTYIIEEVKKAVVGIGFLKPDAEDILKSDTAEKWGLGSGIIVSKNGYILTNQHLAQNVGKKINVTLHDGRTVQGKVVWTEENIDLAIIKINEKNLPRVNLGNSGGLYVGDDVIAIGNPLGVEFQGTTTKGIISGLDRTFLFEEGNEKIFMESLIQTDASINPGNSGGPLIDVNGNVIGINTIKLNDAEGIGFAIPINVVKPVIEKFENDDEFEEATLGIYAYDSAIMPYVNTNVLVDKGIYISKIDDYGPCRKKGLKVGDVITHIDNNEVNKMIEIREYIYTKNPGDEVTLKLYDGAEVKIILAKK